MNEKVNQQLGEVVLNVLLIRSGRLRLWPASYSKYALTPMEIPLPTLVRAPTADPAPYGFSQELVSIHINTCAMLGFQFPPPIGYLPANCRLISQTNPTSLIILLHPLRSITPESMENSRFESNQGADI